MIIEAFGGLTKIEGSSEELDPELQEYLQDDVLLGQILTHPLVYSVPYVDVFNSHLNKLFKRKKEMIKAALEKNNYSDFIHLHERGWRLDAFLEIAEFLRGKEYWELLSNIWVDSENIGQNMSKWIKVLSAEKPYKRNFMNSYERKELEKLPETLKVWRGYKPGINSLHPKNGLSWTLDLGIARWFAERYGTDGKITSRTIIKKEIFALLLRRNEKEVILLNRKVK